MNRVEYLPKFYNKAEVKAKQVELNEAINELLASGKLTEKEAVEVSDVDITLCADTYSRNYQIKYVNELIKFVEIRREG